MVDIRDAFEKFEQDDFIGAKKDLQVILRSATNTYLKDELGLQEDPIKLSPEGDEDNE